MHIVIVTSGDLARESPMGVRPGQVKLQSASWHCCCQVCPFSVFSKMPQLLRFTLQLLLLLLLLYSTPPSSQKEAIVKGGGGGKEAILSMGDGERGVLRENKKKRETATLS